MRFSNVPGAAVTPHQTTKVKRGKVAYWGSMMIKRFLFHHGPKVLDEILIKGSRANPNVSEDVITSFKKAS
jgi:hypothetical protein